MKTIAKLDRTGDSNFFAGEGATAEQQAEAEKVFSEWVGGKRLALQTNRPSGEADAKVKSLDEVEEGAEVLLIPAIVAG